MSHPVSLWRDAFGVFVSAWYFKLVYGSKTPARLYTSREIAPRQRRTGQMRLS